MSRNCYMRRIRDGRPVYPTVGEASGSSVLLGHQGTMVGAGGVPFFLFSFRRYSMMFRNWWRRIVGRKDQLPSRGRRPARTRPQVEPLETRAVPAGNVAAFLRGGDLIVVGDRADN